MSTKIERTKPGSKLEWRVTYDTGSKKWTNDKPGDGKGNPDAKEDLFDDLTVKRGVERIQKAINSYASGEGSENGIQEAVKKLEIHAGKDAALTVTRALYKAVSGDSKVKEGAGIAKDYMNRDRKASMSREKSIADRISSDSRVAVDVEKLISELEELTDRNDHGEAVTLLASTLGNREVVKVMDAISVIQDFLGYMPNELSRERDKIRASLINIAARKFGKEIGRRIYQSM